MNLTNYLGIEAFAKRLQKKLKDIDLPPDFNFSIPMGKGNERY